MKPHIIAGSGGVHLLPTIQQVMGIPESNPVISKKFSDGEIFVQITQNIRNGDVFIVQSTSSPTNDRIMELVLLIDAARRASAERITCVIPYFGYARQDRKEMSRVAISARAVANCLEAAGADRIIALDLHAAPIQGFFNIPVDNLYGGPVIADCYTNNFQFDQNLLTVVSPDVGGVARARRMAEILNGAPLAIIDKRREQHNVAEVMHIIGDVKGRHCFMLDDMIDTAGTACEGRKALLDAGALSVTFAASHGVLSGPALDRIVDSGMDVIITDSIDQSRGPHRAWARGQIRRVSIAPLLAQAILATHNGDSISSLFPSKTQTVAA